MATAQDRYVGYKMANDNDNQLETAILEGKKPQASTDVETRKRPHTARGFSRVATQRVTYKNASTFPRSPLRTLHPRFREQGSPVKLK